MPNWPLSGASIWRCLFVAAADKWCSAGCSAQLTSSLTVVGINTIIRLLLLLLLWTVIDKLFAPSGVQNREIIVCLLQVSQIVTIQLSSGIAKKKKNLLQTVYL